MLFIESSSELNTRIAKNLVTLGNYLCGTYSCLCIPYYRMITWFSIFALSIHGIRSMIFYLGAWIERRKSLPIAVQSPMVSVIIPARNEEDTISSCIHSVMANDYTNFEVIVINDRSTDRTASIVEQLQHQYPRLRLVHTIELTDNSNLQGKTRALHQGITQSSGEILMMTDADCDVQSSWIRSIVGVFNNPGVGLVPSFTVVTTFNLFSRMQCLEWVFNHTLASAGIGLHQPLGCFGNNLSIRRSTYTEIGGYAAIPFSVTEDLSILQTVAQTKKWAIRYVCSHATKVQTKSCPTLPAFIKQHRRWALGGKALGWRALVFVLSSAAIWGGMIISALFAEFEWLLIIVVGRICMDFLVIYPSLLTLRLQHLSVWFPLAVGFFLLLELITPFFLLLPTVEWKGQKLHS